MTLTGNTSVSALSDLAQALTAERDRLRDATYSNGVLINTLQTERDRLRAVNAELLAALKRLVIDYGDVPDASDIDGNAVFDAARAAIAKAKG